jgi:uncharacterized membrane protein
MAGAALPHSLCDVVKGVRIWQRQAVVSLGLMILILTWIPGGAPLIVALATKKARVVVPVTSVVPDILLISFVRNVE